jgi:brefeldin A-inhibited guanine nucleotide-exchange protein
MIKASIPVTYYQRVSAVKSLQKIFSQEQGGKLLVELYLNYDCDMQTGAEENLWEMLITAISHVMTSNSVEQEEVTDFNFDLVDRMPMLTTSNLQNYSKEQVRQLYLATGNSIELKTRVIDLLVYGILYQLKIWGNRSMNNSPVKNVMDDEDDPMIFEMSKNKKQRLQEGINLFNEKPKTAVSFLVQAKIIPSKTPRHVAHFLLNCPGLDKKMIGELLGEGDANFIEIMHLFVDSFDFTGKEFVPALRLFLDRFRLPGEAQKIDRLMLKFAERYVHCNPTSFSSAGN